MTWDRGDIIAIIVVLALVVLGAGTVVATGVWVWQNAQDKRACRTHGGTVVDVSDRTEWHCVGATPEVR